MRVKVAKMVDTRVPGNQRISGVVQNLYYAALLFIFIYLSLFIYYLSLLSLSLILPQK